MKITINIQECEGTEKEIIQREIRRFLIEQFKHGEKAEVKIENETLL
ncbi:MAG: hypothetical protein KKF48_02635 [Nanoarchaeota archaeon]|nr:hypothetical protein [Nanoarchaeota archaeon]